MRVISISLAVAELLPEVFYALDPDVPLDSMELPKSLRRYISNLIMLAFSNREMVEEVINVDWLSRIRKDPSFQTFSGFHWVDLDVIDTEGTFVLILKENR